MKRLNRTLSFILSALLTAAAIAPASGAANIRKDTTPGADAQLISEISKAATDYFSKPENRAGGLTKNQRKIDSTLLGLTGAKKVTDAEKAKTRELLKNDKAFISMEGSEGLIDAPSNDLVYVYIYMVPGTATKILNDRTVTVDSRDEENSTVAAWIELSQLEALSQMDEVTRIETVKPPKVNVGSTLTEGDALLKANLLRATAGVDGGGIKIGIISDGVDTWRSAAATGDLPYSLNVLRNNAGGDEGTAMLEIVHDIAPGAQLYFYDHGSNYIEFNGAIDALADAGCQIICDDIGWMGQPYFEDGPIATHINALVASKNILYFSAAGNFGRSHYQAVYRDTQVSSGSSVYHYHDADPATSGQQLVMLGVYGGDQFDIIAQWNDKFNSSANDYAIELYYYDQSTRRPVYITESDYSQYGAGCAPVEYISYENTSSSIQYYFVNIVKDSGSAKTLELYTPGAQVVQYGTEGDSVFGHQAASGVISVGTVNASSPTTAPWYASQGPCTITYPSAQVRQKPDICGVDGVSVTGAGGFSSEFYGTSAAAPHAAAVAALIWSQSKTKTAAEIKKMLFDSATDLGSGGYDNVYGYGLVNAFASGVPVAPKLSSVNSSGGSAILKWALNTEPDIASYSIEYKPDYSSVWSEVSAGPAVSTATIGSLSKALYTFRISAIDSSGNRSPYSNLLTLDLRVSLYGLVFEKDGKNVLLDMQQYSDLKSGGLFVYEDGYLMSPIMIKTTTGKYYDVSDFIDARIASKNGTNEEAVALISDYPALEKTVSVYTVEYLNGQFIYRSAS